jgi:hypothetical protein
MKRLIWVLSMTFLCGCANFLTTTATSGIGYGMTKQQVLTKLAAKKYPVINQDENTIVAKGMQEQLKQPATKTFQFQDDHLVSVTDQVDSGSSFTFQK